MTDVTRILSAIEQGDPSAAEQLLPLVYDELRKLAAQKMSQENPAQTLQATALVHEAYIRLVESEKAQKWDSRGHFFAAAAEAMRRILVENARRKSGLKYGGDLREVAIEIADLPTRMAAEELIDLDEALEQLGRQDPAKAKLVTLRYFGGMTIEQAAQACNISRVTAHRYWRFSRAWLHRRLKKGYTADSLGSKNSKKGGARED
jgi:RNA polymerase sigma factor (TIGR02999 family)